MASAPRHRTLFAVPIAAFGVKALPDNALTDDNEEDDEEAAAAAAAAVAMFFLAWQVGFGRLLWQNGWNSSRHFVLPIAMGSNIYSCISGHYIPALTYLKVSDTA